MDLKAKIDYSRFEKVLRAVDAHTAGEYCRVMIGIDEPEGNTMTEKKRWLENNYDHIRRALMLEPRGHHDMYGAILCRPVDPQADFGIVFMETGGFLDMCGHCSIGAATVAIEAGLVESHEGENIVTFEASPGIIRAKCMVKDGKVESVTITNVPSFVFLDDQSIEIDGHKINYTIAFGGSFFALADARQLGFGGISPDTLPKYTDIAMKMLDAVNKKTYVKHPDRDIVGVDLVEFYEPAPEGSGADMKNVTIFGEGQADRSPCGTGTSAKLATLSFRGELPVGKDFIYESIIGTRFKGRIKELTTVGGLPAVVPEVTGSSYLVAETTYLIDPADPLKYGFLVH